MLAKTQTASHSETITQSDVAKLWLQDAWWPFNWNWPRCYRMDISGQTLPEMLNNSHRVMSGAKITSISVGLFESLLFHQPLYQWWSIFSRIGLRGNNKKNPEWAIYKLAIYKLYYNAHSSGSDERFLPVAKLCWLRGANGFVFSLYFNVNSDLHRMFWGPLANTLGELW